MIEQYTQEAATLLQKLIATPSVSRDEKDAADIMEQTLRDYGFHPERMGNNVWVKSSQWDNTRPTILLNAHIDTVKPVSTWTRNPFQPTIEGDRLYGLGSNDCGGGLVSLLQVFRINEAAIAQGGAPFPYNILYLASCEEEVSGAGGIRSVLPILFPQHYGAEEQGTLGNVAVAIVGEPTGMQPAIAERGLMVIDGVAHGKSGHAARNEGVNAIYQALDDLLFIREYKFEKVSPLLGPTKMQCTVVNSGTQHNVVPDECRFIIDVRTNELYTNEEVFAFLQSKLHSDITARSFHLHSSSLINSEGEQKVQGAQDAQGAQGEQDVQREQKVQGVQGEQDVQYVSLPETFLQKFQTLGMTPFGSPTLSDQALMRFPSFKLGPGESSRSHSADEYICLSELRHAIETYIKLLS